MVTSTLNCLWTDGLTRTQYEAERYCRQRNDSFLARINSDSVQSKLLDFRAAAGNLLGSNCFWIDVTTASIDNFHWIDGSQLARWFLFIHMILIARGVESDGGRSTNYAANNMFIGI